MKEDLRFFYYCMPNFRWIFLEVPFLPDYELNLWVQSLV